jgi:polysaccharide export outer membrane protein
MQSTDPARRGMLRCAARAIPVALVVGLSLPGCAALPRSGPLASELDTREDDRALDGLVVPLTPAVAAMTERGSTRRFPDAFLRAADVNPEVLGIGDELDVLIWEPGGNALFGAATPATGTGGAGTGSATLPAVRIDRAGKAFIPYLGPVAAAGHTPAALRERIRAGLSRLADRPEVDLRLRTATSRMVTVQGAVGRPGVYMIERGFTRLAPVLALAGGSPGLPEQVEVTVRRDGVIGAEMLEDVYRDPRLDIALRPGDVIVLNPIRERFVALGASSAQAEVVFPTRRLTLLSALGAVAGLRDFDADATGVFVLRFEEPRIAAALLDAPPPPGLPVDRGRPLVYRLDMTNPEGVFAAKLFLVRDGDTILATNAPLTELRKLIQIFTSVLTPVQQSVGIGAAVP